jgi:hypothetical protein
MAKLQLFDTFDIPLYYVCPIEYGLNDEYGLSEEEEKEIRKFLETLPNDCVWSFSDGHYFKHSNAINSLGSDCVEMSVFVKRRQ